MLGPRAPVLVFDLIRKRLRHFQDLLRSSPNPIVLGEVHPTHSPGRVHQELSRPRDVVAVLSLPWMYQVVLREAGSTEDLAYLNGEMLTALWPDLYLPKGVRQAWEDQHPELHAAPAPAA